jgi:hypothetical protein
MNREQLIEALIDDMMNTMSNSGWYASSICADGFKGFNNYIDEELLNEYNELMEARN